MSYGTRSSPKRRALSRRQSSNTSRSEASLAQLSRELGIDAKAVAKWRERDG